MIYALLFFFIAAHALMDYSLQTDTIAGSKCPTSTHPAAKAVPWYYWLTAHAFMHGAAVGAIIRWFGFDWNVVAAFAAIETVTHWWIDLAKCWKWYNIHTDQILHIVCKLVWWGVLISGAVGVSGS
jgi:hypothetical protein